MMERLADDAVNIQRILTWVENKEDIVNFLRKVPLDQSHLRIPLGISYFLNLRDQSEENSEQNIENDAREIVIILPDTPYTLIKNRLWALGNIPNRKEVVVKQIIKERPELKRLVKELTDTNVMRKRICDESVSVDQINDETNIKIKIRKVDGSLEVVSSITQEIVPSSVKLKPTDFPSCSNSDLQSEKKHSQINCLGSSTTVYPDPNINLPSTSKCYSPPRFENFRPTSSEQSTRIRTNLHSGFDEVSTQSSSSITHPQPKLSPPVTGCMQITHTMSENGPIEVPSTPFDLINYLKGVTQCSQERIKSVCEEMNVDTNVQPHNVILNELVNRLCDNVIVLDDTDGSDVLNALDLSYPVEFIDEVVAKDETKASSRSIIKPATFVFEERAEIPALPSRNVIQPARLNLNRSPTNVIPAMPKELMEKVNGRNHFEVPDILELETAPNSSVFPNVLLPNVSERAPLPRTSSPIKTPSAESEGAIALHYDENLVNRIMEMFPEACPNYIKKISSGRQWRHLDEVVTIILSEESYPRRPQRAPSPPKEYDIEEQLEIVKALLPDADPTYLRWKCETIGNNPEALNEFINNDRETRKYPTMKEYLRKQKLSAQSKQYTDEFSVEKFVELFPDPEKTFRDPKRKYNIDDYTSLYICTFFQNRYDKVPVKLIRATLSQLKNNVLLADDALKRALALGQVMKTRRKPSRLQDAPQNIAVLQELAYLTHQEDIQGHMKAIKEREEEERRIAKEAGLMNTCECCYDDEIMPKDTFSCPKRCTFCRGCIQQSCEVAMGDARTEFKCLNDCSEEFALHTLQKVLPPKMFSKLAQKKALAEVKAAGIEELESCPFCDFASIPNPEDKIYRCLNPDCMKESCRLCKEENHVPYKCNEVEKADDVKARVFIENQMTEALLRKCWKCSTSFFKEEGCNMMTCTCGARLCYICKQPVQDYNHFNGIGGDKFERCPLYSDTNSLNAKSVLRAAEEAKSKVDPAKLKVDPSLDVQQHYEKRKRELPQEPYVQIMQDMRRMQADIRPMQMALMEQGHRFEAHQQQLQRMRRHHHVHGHREYRQ